MSEEHIRPTFRTYGLFEHGEPSCAKMPAAEVVARAAALYEILCLLHGPGYRFEHPIERRRAEGTKPDELITYLPIAAPALGPIQLAIHAELLFRASRSLSGAHIVQQDYDQALGDVVEEIAIAIGGKRRRIREAVNAAGAAVIEKGWLPGSPGAPAVDDSGQGRYWAPALCLRMLEGACSHKWGSLGGAMIEPPAEQWWREYIAGYHSGAEAVVESGPRDWSSHRRGVEALYVAAAESSRSARTVQLVIETLERVPALRQLGADLRHRHRICSCFSEFRWCNCAHPMKTPDMKEIQDGAIASGRLGDIDDFWGDSGE